MNRFFWGLPSAQVHQEQIDLFIPYRKIRYENPNDITDELIILYEYVSE